MCESVAHVTILLIRSLVTLELKLFGAQHCGFVWSVFLRGLRVHPAGPEACVGVVRDDDRRRYVRLLRSLTLQVGLSLALVDITASSFFMW